VVYIAKPETGTSVSGSSIQSADAIAGGTFEASGIAHIPGTDSFLFVDDGKPGEVLLMQLDNSGKQSGPVKSLSLGVEVDDPEGITTDGSFFYVVGSQSRAKGLTQPGIVRFKLNKDAHTVEQLQSLGELRKLLVDQVTELRELGSNNGKDEAINIEGLAWDPSRGALLLGLRSPVIDGKAVLVPIKMHDAKGSFSNENLEPGKIETIKIGLGGTGIRSIEYDERQKVFYIIGGAADGQEKTDFKLWEWNGQVQGGLREITTFDKKLQPEGVAAGTLAGSNFKVIVFDSSKYLAMQ
jgi:hypothetical protein